MNVTIEVDDGAVKAAFAQMIAAGTNPRPYLTAIGAALVSSTQLRFNDSRAPDGSTWHALSPVTIALRRKGKGKGGAKPLLDTGRLRNSISYAVDANSVTVGSNVVYARMQQFGAKMGEFGRYSQLKRVREFGLGTFKGSAGTQKGFPIPWGNVPPRPFLGLSADDRSDVLGILAAHLVPQ
jgi:phage virion morphogenesis protein